MYSVTSVKRAFHLFLLLGALIGLLGPEAAGSGRAPLLIARRKDDRSLLTCFAEEP